jgi:phage terminase small subunit
MADLTEKQRRFVEAYVGPSRGDAADAARRAGYAGDAASLERTGRRNLENRYVRDAVARARKGRSRARGRQRVPAGKILEAHSGKRKRILELGNPRLRLAKKLRKAR